MNAPALLIACDRGSLKAYRVEAIATGQAARLLESMDFTDAHGKYADKYTDMAGAFPAAGTGGQGNAHAERMGMDAERETRLFRQIAAQITTLLERENPERWGFAAPSEINGAIADGLGERWKERLEVNLPRDLVNVPAQELPEFFAK